MRKSERIGWLQGVVDNQDQQIRVLTGLIRELVAPTQPPQQTDWIVPQQNGDGGVDLEPDPVPEWEGAENWQPANWGDLVEIEGEE